MPYIRVRVIVAQEICRKDNIILEVFEGHIWSGSMKFGSHLSFLNGKVNTFDTSIKFTHKRLLIKQVTRSEFSWC